jgi:hypothetical protein
MTRNTSPLPLWERELSERFASEAGGGIAPRDSMDHQIICREDGTSCLLPGGDVKDARNARPLPLFDIQMLEVGRPIP